MDELDPAIDVIWGMATDDTLDEDAKITILATGFDNTLPIRKQDDDISMDEIINEIYGERKKKIPVTVSSQTTVPVGQAISLGGEEEEHEPTPQNENIDKVENESSEDPSRAFFNRVKNRFLQGLSSLTKEE